MIKKELGLIQSQAKNKANLNDININVNRNIDDYLSAKSRRPSTGLKIQSKKNNFYFTQNNLLMNIDKP